MDNILKVKTDNYIKIYNELYKKYKWSENDTFLKLASLAYARHNNRLDPLELENIMNHIKSSTGVFSPLRSYGKITISSLLINGFENPREAFDSLLTCCSVLKDAKFGNDIYTAISSLVILLSGVENDRLKLLLSRAGKIYELFKKQHMFLTSHDDYPMVFVLAGLEEDESSIASRVEEFYNRLADCGFKKGNELQRLSQVLTAAGVDIDSSVDRCSRILNSFTELKLPYYRINYIQMGALSLMEGDCSKIAEDVKEVFEYLKAHERSKIFCNIQTITMIASDLVSSEMVNTKGLNSPVESGVSAAVHSMVMAQEAAMIASISAAATVVIASSSSS